MPTHNNSDNATMPIVEFLDKHKIAYTPVQLRMPEKKPVRFPRVGSSGIAQPCNKKSSDKWMFNGDHLLLQKEHPESEFLWVDTYEITQIDIDGDTTFKLDAPYHPSIGRGTPHYFVSKTNLTKGTRKPETLSDGCQLDILRGQASFVRRDALVYNADKPISNHDATLADDINPSSLPDKDVIQKQFILNNEKWIKDTGLWKSYGSLYKSLMNDFEEFDRLSRGEHTKSRQIPEKYDAVKNRALWDSFPTLGTGSAYKKLKALVSKSPKMKKEFVALETDDHETTAHELAVKVCDYYDNQIYAYHDVIYIKQKTGIYIELPLDKSYAHSVIRRDLLLEYTYLGDCPADCIENVRDGRRPAYLQLLMDELYKRGRDAPHVKETMNANHNYIGFTNGILRLNDMHFSECGFDDAYVSWTTGYDFPTTEADDDYAEIFDTWLERYALSVDGQTDIRADVKTMIIEALCDENKHERAFFMKGEGSNGKSVLCSMLTNALGAYAVTLPYKSMTQPLEADGKRPDIKGLRNKRVVIVGEGDNSTQGIHSGLFKTLATSNDDIKCRDLHEKLSDQKSFKGRFKFFIPLNENPAFSGDFDFATKRRVFCQSSPNTFMDVATSSAEDNIHPIDRELIRKVELYTPYIWHWLYSDIIGYYERGLLPFSDAFNAGTNEFRANCDVGFRLFLENADECQDERVSIQEVWAKIEEKTNRYDRNAVSKSTFFKSVRMNLKKCIKSERPRVNGKKVLIDYVMGYALCSDSQMRDDADDDLS
jgi:hypothetical protein